MKTCCLDIETTSLEGVGGALLLCAVVRPLNGKPKVFKFGGQAREAQRVLLRKVWQELEKYQVWILHNAKFDLNFLRTRSEILGLSAPQCKPVYDTMRAFKRSGLRSVLNYRGQPSASLQQISALFHIRGLKTVLDIEENWSIVWDGSRRALRELVHHCVLDTQATEAVFHRLLPLDPRPRLDRLW